MMSGGAARTPGPIEIVNRIKLILFSVRRSLERGKNRYVDNMIYVRLYTTNRFLNAYEIKKLFFFLNEYSYSYNIIYYYTSY